jgi:hypothetical protein
MEPLLQPFLQKENMLLQLRVQLAASFNTHLRRKNHNAFKSIIIPILPLAHRTIAGPVCGVSGTVTDVTAANRQLFTRVGTQVPNR